MPEANPRVGADLQALVEQALVGVYVVQDGRLVYANPRLAELFGYTTAALLALPSVLALVAARAIVRRWRSGCAQRIAGDTLTSTHVMQGLRATAAPSNSRSTARVPSTTDGRR